jgi:hypothetical protein
MRPQEAHPLRVQVYKVASAGQVTGQRCWQNLVGSRICSIAVVLVRAGALRLLARCCGRHAERCVLDFSEGRIGEAREPNSRAYPKAKLRREQALSAGK